MDGGVGIEYSWLNSLYLSEIVVNRYLNVRHQHLSLYTAACIHTVDINNNDLDTTKRGSHQCLEILTGYGRVPHLRTTFHRPRYRNRHTIKSRATTLLRQDGEKEWGMCTEMEQLLGSF
jgi:hypothetical protein